MSIVLLPVATMWASSLPHPPASIIPGNSDNTTVYWAVICFKHLIFYTGEISPKEEEQVCEVIGSSDLMSYSHSCGRSLSTLNILLPEACGQGWRTLGGEVVTVKHNSSRLRWEGPYIWPLMRCQISLKCHAHLLCWITWPTHSALDTSGL